MFAYGREIILQQRRAGNYVFLLIQFVCTIVIDVDNTEIDLY